jgi:hypothetical protein
VTTSIQGPDEYLPFDVESVWCQPDDFARRVDDELYRSRRHGVAVSLLFVSFPLTFSPEAAEAVTAFVAEGLRRLDFAGMAGDADYGICLPHTDRDGTAAVVSRLLLLATSFPVEIGIASSPADGSAYEELLAAARDSAKMCLGVAA